MMKRMIMLFCLFLLMAVPLFSENTYIDPDEGWKVTDTVDTSKPETNQYANLYKFTVVFDGAEYADIGFSKTKTTYTSGQGLAKNEFDNKSVTLKQTAHDTSSTTPSYSYSTPDTYYIYWYLSVKEAMKLYLTVDSSESDNSISVNLKTYSYTIGTTVTETASKSEISITSDSGKTAIVEVPSSYAVVQGNTAFTVSATVKKYPDSRRVGTLKLTLESA